MKKCSKCGEIKSRCDFYRQSKCPDGLRSMCKKCSTPYSIKSGVAHKKRCKEKAARYGISTSSVIRYGIKKALFVYDRAKRKCEICGNENNLIIHHKDGNGVTNPWKGLPMNNDESNLQVICNRCHGSYHAKKYFSSVPRKSPLNITCKNCGKVFANKRNSQSLKFCSRVCSSRFNSRDVLWGDKEKKDLLIFSVNEFVIKYPKRTKAAYYLAKCIFRKRGDI